MNKLALLFLIVGLCKTLDAYCVNRCAPVAVYVPCATPCVQTCAAIVPCPVPVCASCPASDCMKSCSACKSPCNSDCTDPECQCLKALTHFPDVEYPMCAIDVIKPYYF